MTNKIVECDICRRQGIFEHRFFGMPESMHVRTCYDCGNLLTTIQLDLNYIRRFVFDKGSHRWSVNDIDAVLAEARRRVQREQSNAHTGQDEGS